MYLIQARSRSVCPESGHPNFTVAGAAKQNLGALHAHKVGPGARVVAHNVSTWLRHAASELPIPVHTNITIRAAGLPAWGRHTRSAVHRQGPENGTEKRHAKGDAQRLGFAFRVPIQVMSLGH